MNWKERYTVARKDFDRLVVIHLGGYPIDWCGGFCNMHRFDELLHNPTKKTAALIYEDAIRRFITCGAEGIDMFTLVKSDEVKRILQKYVDVDTFEIFWNTIQDLDLS